MKERGNLIAIDIDLTLTKGTAWTPAECLTQEPNPEMVDFVNKNYPINHIVIYTARGEGMRNETECWLKNNGVRYHALRMDKMAFDCLIDDKCFNSLDDLKKHERTTST